MKRTSLLAICGLVSSVLFAQKDEVPKGWHMMDKATTGYYGLSVDKAYQFVKTKKLKSKTVIVAVIDSGIDTLHEDLKAVLWKNPKEIPGNGIDDDKNGYVDDIYGWNFLGRTPMKQPGFIINTKVNTAEKILTPLRCPKMKDLNMKCGNDLKMK